MSNKRNEVMKAQTNLKGVAVFYTELENRTDEEGKAEVSRYVVTVTNTLKETVPIKNLLVSYIPEVLDKDGNIVTEQEIRVTIDDVVSIPKGGKTQISVFDNELSQYVQNIKVRFITEVKKTDSVPTEEPKETEQPQEKQTNNNLLQIIKKIKSKLWR
ncbi:MAG: hypothetical protein J6A61_02560 [Clostridia bacterium]|nr:hypothetical protein [Clostridia bacterium]